MEIKLSIDQVTRTDYSQDGGAIKGVWEKNDKVSVLSYKGRKVQTCDTFTTSESGSSVTFTGTYTGDSDADMTKIIYPALTSTGTIDEVTGWADPLVSGMYSGHRFCILDANRYDNYRCAFDFSFASQPTDGSPSFLKYYDYMDATVTDITNVTSASMEKNISVIRAVINTASIPAGTIMKRVRVTNSASVFSTSGRYTDAVKFNSSPDYTYGVEVYLGKNSSGEGSISSFSGITKSASDNELVVYLPFMSNNGKNTVLSSGNSLTITVFCGADGDIEYSKTSTLSKDLVIHPGGCFTLKASVNTPERVVKLPIEYMAEYNLAKAKEFATSHNSGKSEYFMAETQYNYPYLDQIKVKGYHVPTIYEWNGVRPSSGTTEIITIGKEVTEKTFKVEYSIVNNVRYGIKFKDTDFESAYKYEMDGSNLVITARWLGKGSGVTLATIAKPSWWQSGNQGDIVRILPAIGMFSNNILSFDGESACYWSSTPVENSSPASHKAVRFSANTNWDLTAANGSRMPVRLFAD